MVGRVLLGVIAAMWSVLIPGEAGAFVDRLLEWPQMRRPEPATATIAELEQPAFLRIAA